MNKYASRFEADQARPKSLTPERARLMLPKLVPDGMNGDCNHFENDPDNEEAEWIVNAKSLYLFQDFMRSMFGDTIPSNAALDELQKHAKEILDRAVLPANQ
jgi:hypothetical protein